jgi:hypothetical protein
MGEGLSFRLPKSLEIDLSGDSITLRHDADIHIEQTLGRQIDTIAGEQNVTVSIPRITGTIIAAGDIRLEGAVEAKLIYGRHVVITADSIKCTAIAATHSLTIRCSNLTCDVIMAPQVNLADKAKGRVTMLESKNPCDTTQFKGGFSYEQYEEIFGNANAFLAARGLDPMGDPPPEAEVNAFDPDGTSDPAHLPDITDFQPLEEVESVEDSDSEEDTIDGEGELLAFHMSEMADEASTPAGEAHPPPAPVGPPQPPPIKDSLSVSTVIAAPQDDSFYVVEETEEVEISFPPETKERITQAIQRISACYPEDNKPPALVTLNDFVKNDDYLGLRRGIGDVWNSVLSYHSDNGIRPNRKVTHVFNLIHGMVGGT